MGMIYNYIYIQLYIYTIIYIYNYIYIYTIRRAKKASARNFEVIDPYDHNIIYLLHGKWEKNMFNLDYRYPMTML
jgi:hypothetical protein